MAGLPKASASNEKAQVAQLVEHATENRSVGCSIHPLGTIPPFFFDVRIGVSLATERRDAALVDRDGLDQGVDLPPALEAEVGNGQTRQ